MADVEPHPTTSDVMLKRLGLRRTPARVAVLGVLARGGRPMGVAEVLKALPADTDPVTVYRTLNTFTREKLVHRVRGDDRTWRYALSDSPAGPAADPAAPAGPHAHAHFVCDECGTVDCLEASKIPKGLVGSLRVGPGYAVRYPEVLLHGVCPRCRE